MPSAVINMKPDLTDIEYANVCKVITSRMGLNFSYGDKTNLSRTLARAAKDLGFEDPGTIVRWVISPTTENDAFESLVPYLTNSETYFWREPMVFAALTDNILPDLVSLKKDKDKKITIWCAGCSTGEEAYSIAIALYRTIPVIKDWRITILATDIDKNSLNTARKGVYGPWSFRNSPLWLKNRYMNRLENNELEVKSEIREMVNFSCFNLIQDNYRTTVCRNLDIDIIFCRNVMMYFTKEWAAEVSRKLFDTLTEDGWLIVSSCELSSTLFPDIVPRNFPGAVLYHKNKKNISGTNIILNEPGIQTILSDFHQPEPAITAKTQDPVIVFNPVTPESRPKPVSREEIVTMKENLNPETGG